MKRAEEVNECKPKYMYPHQHEEPDNADKPKKDVTLSDSAMATIPMQSHTYSAAEMSPYRAKNRKPLSDSPKSFKEIIQAAIVLSRLIEQSHLLGNKKQPSWVHRPDRPYTKQEVVHLCCLVDVERPLSVDTHFNEKSGDIRLKISSYKINPVYKLETYMKQSNRVLDADDMDFYVFRPWLKNYLDCFNPIWMASRFCDS
jgi:hypothetical protein